MPSILRAPHVLGGVSQLPPQDRDLSQCVDLDNAHLSVANGLRIRPPFSTIDTICADSVDADKWSYHFINLSPTERYLVVVGYDKVEVYDVLTGNPQTVHTPNGLNYTRGNGGSGTTDKAMRFCTVGDSTFIVNKDWLVKQGTTKYALQKDPFGGADVLPYKEAIIFVRQGDYNTTYTVTINGLTCSVSTPSESTANSRAAIATTAIASDLYDALVATNALRDSASAMTFQLMGSSIWVEGPNGRDFQISTQDGLADKGLRVIKGKVETLEDLPAKARPGMIVEITGAPGSNKDNLWVVYEETGDTEGLWRECPKPGVVTDLDISTMPHALVRNGLMRNLGAAEDLPHQPTSTNKVSTQYKNGWTTDGADVALSGSEDTSKEVTADGGAVRTPAVTGYDASLQRDVTIWYDIDLSQVRSQTDAKVTLSVNTGAGWSEVTSKTFASGANYLSQSFNTRMVVPNGTRFELKLNHGKVWSETPTKSRDPRLTAHGKASKRAGCIVAVQPGTYMMTGYPGEIWPKGMTASFKLDGTSFSTTLTADKTTAELNTALSALVDLHASFKSSYAAPSGVPVSTKVLDYFVVSTNSDAPVAVTELAFTLPQTTHCYIQGAGLTADAYVGKKVRNLTDRCEGTITSNTGTCVIVGSLTGGTVNKFRPGDVIAIIGTGASDWTFGEVNWTGRLVGDDDLSPLPSFVDRKITDVFFYAGRLGFTSEDRVLLSASTDLYRFTRATVTQLLDDDPIDIQSALKEACWWDSATPWNGKLLLSSAAGLQATLYGEPILSPATVKLEHLSSYVASPLCRPMTFGGSLLLANLQSGYGHIRELVLDQNGQASAREWTNHVPRYIDGQVKALAGDAGMGFLFAITDKARSGSPGSAGNSMFVMSRIPNGERDMLSWCRWNFQDGYCPLAVDFYDGYLYLVLAPYNTAWPLLMVKINVADPTADTTITDAGLYSIDFIWRPAAPYLREKSGRSLVEGRTQVQSVAVEAHEASSFAILVAPENRDSKLYTHYVSKKDNKRVPVMAKNDKATITIFSTSGACAFSGLSWEVTHTSRSQ